MRGHEEMTGGDQGKGVIARRLGRLFETVQPLGRPYTLREVVDGVNTAAGENLLSFQYLSQLRKGDRAHPGYAVLEGITKWFGVSVNYFSDEEIFQRTDDELQVLALMRDSGIRSLAFRAAGVSEESLAMVAALLDKVRQAEGLPEHRESGAPDNPGSVGKA
jgi:transcriptional regulator with XRE-family HTH domain